MTGMVYFTVGIFNEFSKNLIFSSSSFVCFFGGYKFIFHMENWIIEFFKQNLPDSVSGKNNIYIPFLSYVNVTCPLLIKMKYFTFTGVLFLLFTWWLDYQE